MIEDVSNRLGGGFVECLRSSLETPVAPAGGGDSGASSQATGAASSQAAAAEPIKGGRLFCSVLWERIKRLLGGGSTR